jgi:hypothetical protein
MRLARLFYLAIWALGVSGLAALSSAAAGGVQSPGQGSSTLPTGAAPAPRAGGPAGAVAPLPKGDYTADTVEPARRQGAVAAGGVTWQCAGSRCAARTAWREPTVEQCLALAREVGAIKGFGTGGRGLGAVQLAQCNQGVASAAPASVARIANTPAHSPDHLDFGAVWDGEAATRTLSLTTLAAGHVRAELPAGPFFVTEIRELGPPRTGSKNLGGPPQVSMTVETKGRVTFPDGGAGPWTYGADAGSQVILRVVFKPKLDLGGMLAGPKKATLKVSGPGPRGNWTLAIPLTGTFNGTRLAPLVILLEKEILKVATPFQTADLAVRLVGTGEAVSGDIVWASLTPGLKPGVRKGIQLGASETKEVKIQLDAGTTDREHEKAFDGTVAFRYARAGGGAQETAAVPFKATFVPDFSGRNLAEKTCHGTPLMRGHVSFGADGRISVNVWFASQYAVDTRFEVVFPQAGKTFLRTRLPDGVYGKVITESGAGTWQSNTLDIGGKYTPGSPDSLDVYRSLLRSSAELRCW